MGMCVWMYILLYKCVYVCMYIWDPVGLRLRHLYQVEFCSFIVRYHTAEASLYCGHISSFEIFSWNFSRPRWLSWMRCLTGDQEVAGSTPTEVGNILSWRLIMKYFLRSFSPFRWFKKGSCQFLAKECAQYWLTA